MPRINRKSNPPAGKPSRASTTASPSWRPRRKRPVPLQSTTLVSLPIIPAAAANRCLTERPIGPVPVLLFRILRPILLVSSNSSSSRNRQCKISSFYLPQQDPFIADTHSFFKFQPKLVNANIQHTNTQILEASTILATHTLSCYYLTYYYNSPIYSYGSYNDAC